MGDQCFSGCESLEEIKLPINSLNIISKNSFHGCSNLKNIKIPSSVNEIQQTTFGFANSFGFELYLQYDGTLEDFNSIQKGSNNISAWYENITLIIEASDGTTVFN